MHIIRHRRLSVYFGSRVTAQPRSFFESNPSQEQLCAEESIAACKELLAVKTLFFPKQMHGRMGSIITSDMLPAIQPEADFVLTHIPQYGIGIYTADCLPIILYDNKQHVVGIVHAGWRGALAQIAIEAVASMQASYGSQLEDIEVFFGPAAGVCCYEVGPEFVDKLQSYSFKDSVLKRRNGILYFNTVAFNSELLKQAGISVEQLHTEYFECTICNEQYCSYRREGAGSLRQLAIATIS